MEYKKSIFEDYSDMVSGKEEVVTEKKSLKEMFFMTFSPEFRQIPEEKIEETGYDSYKGGMKLYFKDDSIVISFDNLTTDQVSEMAKYKGFNKINKESPEEMKKILNKHSFSGKYKD